MEKNNSGEIDIRYLYRKSKSGMRRMAQTTLRIIAFYRKFWIVLILLILVGFAWGFYKDKKATKSYVNKVLVIPNVDNTNYLYDKIEAIDSKIKSGDTAFLKSVFNEDYQKVRSIKIEAVVDFYGFIQEDSRNLDVTRIFGINKDLKNYADIPVNSRGYKYHTMTVVISGNTSSEQIIASLMTFINSNDHFQNYFRAYKELKDYELKQFYTMIAQSDSLIKAASSGVGSDFSGVSVNSNTNIQSLIFAKTDLVQALFRREKEIIDATEPVKVVNVDYNLEVKRFLSFSNKVKYPLIFVMLFSAIFLIRYLYRKMKVFAQEG